MSASWWRHQMDTFSALLTLCAGNSPVPVISPHKGQWRGALMFTLICARINDWVNNREAGDLRRHLDHYDVSVMMMIADVLTPNRQPTINSHHNDSKLITWYYRGTSTILRTKDIALRSFKNGFRKMWGGRQPVDFFVIVGFVFTWTNSI